MAKSLCQKQSKAFYANRLLQRGRRRREEIMRVEASLLRLEVCLGW